jgi:hypothetical protein
MSNARHDISLIYHRSHCIVWTVCLGAKIPLRTRRRRKHNLSHSIHVWEEDVTLSKNAGLDTFAFSRDMWPEGATNMADSPDLGWQSATPGKTYMTGISPWIFCSRSRTGSPDWVWGGDDTWWIDGLRL